MIYRLVKNKIYRITVLLWYSICSNKGEIYNQINFLNAYANQISKKININDKFFYLNNNNKFQINLQKNVINYCLISKECEISNIIKYNMNEIVYYFENKRYSNVLIFEYLNVVLIYYILIENDIERAKKVFEIVNRKNFKLDSYGRYIFERSRYFFGEVNYHNLLEYLSNANILYYDSEISLINGFNDKYLINNI